MAPEEGQGANTTTGVANVWQGAARLPRSRSALVPTSLCTCGSCSGRHPLTGVACFLSSEA